MRSPLRRKMRRDLWARKGALVSLSAIIALGIGCYVGMTGTYLDLVAARDRYYGDYRLADFTVSFKGAPAGEVARLEELPNVRLVEGRVVQSLAISLPEIEGRINGQAISLPGTRRPGVNNLLLTSGSWFSADDALEAIVLEDFARARGIAVGGSLHVRLPDGAHDVSVVGIARSPEFVWVLPPSGGVVPDPANYGIVYLPEKFLQQASNLEGSVNQVIGLAYEDDPASLAQTIQLIEERLDPCGVTSSTPLEESTSVALIRDQLNQVRNLSRLFPAVFLFVGAMVLNVLLDRLVAQQRTAIGTLRALGHTRHSVLRHYMGYGITIGVLGGGLGLVVGWFLQQGMLGMYRTEFAFPDVDARVHADILGIGVAIALTCAVLGTLKGARRATRLEPAEAMRPAVPEKGGRVLPERIPVLWRMLSFRTRMVLRTIFRNPFRSSITVMASTLSTVLIVATIGTWDAVNYIKTYQFEYVSHEDRALSLDSPRAAGALEEVESFTGVGMVEGWLLVPCDLSNGPYRKRIAVTGLESERTMLTPLGSNGSPIQVPASGIILTSKLAEVLHVKAGDEVLTRPLVGIREGVRLPVVSVVDSYVGLDAYSHIEQLSRLLGEERVVNRIGLRTRNGAPPPSFERQIEMRLPITGMTERRVSEQKMAAMLDQSMGTAVGAMILFAAIIAFGSVINTGLVSMSERIREVGTLRVLGTTPWRILGIFSKEALFLNIVGIGIGMGAGVGVLHLFVKAFDTESLRFPVIVRADSLAASAALMLAFVTVAQILLYHILRRLDWLEALKVKE